MQVDKTMLLLSELFNLNRLVSITLVQHRQCKDLDVDLIIDRVPMTIKSIPLTLQCSTCKIQYCKNHVPNVTGKKSPLEAILSKKRHSRAPYSNKNTK